MRNEESKKTAKIREGRILSEEELKEQDQVWKDIEESIENIDKNI